MHMHDEVIDVTEVDIQTIMGLASRLDRLMDAIETVKEKQEEMAANINEIKKAVYHPDSGIYTRLRMLEQWRSTSSKVLWFLATSFGGMLAAAIWTKFF